MMLALVKEKVDIATNGERSYTGVLFRIQNFQIFKEAERSCPISSFNGMTLQGNSVSDYRIDSLSSTLSRRNRVSRRMSCQSE